MKSGYFICGVIVIALAFGLERVFSGTVVLPQTFHLFGLEIRYYGLILASAVFFSYLYALKNLKQTDLSEIQADHILTRLLIFGFIGARVYHILSDFGYYLANPWQGFAVWEGGLSIYGGVIGALLFLVFWAKNKTKLFMLLDWLVPSLLLGQIIGRFANLFNYELFGFPTNLLWKMFVPLQFRPETYVFASYFHPLFLYELLGNLVILGVILLIRRRRVVLGRLFLFYLLFYNTLRFFLEFLRIDAEMLGNYRQNALVSAGVVLIVCAYLFYDRNRKISQN